MKRRPKLNYTAYKNSRIEKIGNTIIYSAVPHSKEDEISAKVILEWSGSQWSAFVKGNYNSLRECGNYWEGHFHLNIDACEKIYQAFGIKDYTINKDFVKDTSIMSPKIIEEMAKYQKEFAILIEDKIH